MSLVNPRNKAATDWCHQSFKI